MSMLSKIARFFRELMAEIVETFLGMLLGLLALIGLATGIGVITYLTIKQPALCVIANLGFLCVLFFLDRWMSRYSTRRYQSKQNMASEDNEGLNDEKESRQEN